MNTHRIALLLVLVMLAGAGTALAMGWILASQPDAPGLEVTASAAGEALITTGADPFALGSAAQTRSPEAVMLDIVHQQPLEIVQPEGRAGHGGGAGPGHARDGSCDGERAQSRPHRAYRSLLGSACERESPARNSRDGALSRRDGNKLLRSRRNGIRTTTGPTRPRSWCHS